MTMLETVRAALGATGETVAKPGRYRMLHGRASHSITPDYGVGSVQNQYVGDIGDYAKFSLLRALLGDHKLGVSWYLFPDEGTNDGKHVGYLEDPKKWQRFDERTFKILGGIVKSCRRNVSAIEQSCLFPRGTVFWNSELNFEGSTRSCQAKWRTAWFEQSMECLRDCDLVFADPDNGLKSSKAFRPGQRKHAKSISECEVRSLAGCGRTIVIYHHNTRFKGGHDAEVRFWQKRLGGRTCAIRWRHISPRTFFICNCTEELASRAKSWCNNWDSPKKVYFERGNWTG